MKSILILRRVGSGAVWEISASDFNELESKLTHYRRVRSVAVVEQRC